MPAVNGNRHPRWVEPPPDAAAANALSAMRRRTELLFLSFLLAAYALVYAVDISVFYRTMNVAGPVAITAILGWSCYRIVRQSPITIWAPLFWFRLACATYFGVGALVPHIVNEETRQYIYKLHYFGDISNFKINTIYLFGIIATIGFSYIFIGRKMTLFSVMAIEISRRRALDTLFFSFCFLLVGAVLRYGFVVPYSFGLTNAVLPGMIGTLSNMYYVGVYLLIVYGTGINRKFLLLAWILIGFDIAVSVMSFAKMEILLILIFSFLGFISRQATKAKIVLGAFCVLSAYFAFQPLVGYGRDQIAMRYGKISGAGLGERWEIVQRYLDGGSETVSSTYQDGLARLSYVNVAAFVIDRYDAGMPGDTLRSAPAVLIPRMLWPDKPIITQLGADLNYLVFGQDGSQLGVGHFAEAYWNFGWLGIAPFMAVLALVLSVFTRFSMRVMAHGDWLFLPVVFIGVNMGLRVDGHFVPDILGPAWMAVCLGLALKAAKIVSGMPSWPRRRFIRHHPDRA